MGSRRLESVHEFYRYPARFSPGFARAVVQAFTRPGDIVLDPFVGGGTTLVESRLLGRPSIGADISALAAFVSRAKTTLPSADDLVALAAWRSVLEDVLRLSGRTRRPNKWDEQGYLRGLGGNATWRIRDLLVRALDALSSVSNGPPELLGRCAILRTAQWALDMRRVVPTVEEFRAALIGSTSQFINVARNQADAVRHADFTYPTSLPRTTVLQQALPGLSTHPAVSNIGQPSLVITSPPYPGVYVLYHRWKLQGRKEIAAPFWLADSPDGHGMAHYTMSARARQTLDLYFEQIQNAFADLVQMAGNDTWIVQLVGFSNVSSQLSRYLGLLADVGLKEVRFPELSTASDGRLWRNVPSRRWWVTATSRNQVAAHTAQEVVLIHRPG